MSITSSLNAGISGLRANAKPAVDHFRQYREFGNLWLQTGANLVSFNGYWQRPRRSEAPYSAGGVRTSTLRLADQGGALIGTQKCN